LNVGFPRVASTLPRNPIAASSQKAADQVGCLPAIQPLLQQSVSQFLQLQRGKLLDVSASPHRAPSLPCCDRNVIPVVLRLDLPTLCCYETGNNLD
jgi:hypothetical protein